jgi:signal transduction histidine kinase
MIRKRYRSFLAVVTIILMIIAQASELLYFSDLDYKLRTRRFNKILAEKEKITEECLESLKKFMEHSEAHGSMSKDKVFRLAGQEGITILEYFNSSNLVYWSDNSFDVPKVIDSNLFDKPFVFIQNGWFLTKTIQTGSEKIVGLLRVRTDYGFENELVRNGFEKAFHVSENVGFSRDRNSSPYHVFNSKGDFLFSLIFPLEKDINYLIVIPLIMWSISFFLIILLTVEFSLSLVRRKKFLSAFFVPVAVFSIIYSVFLFFGKPAVFFQTDLFSPYNFTLSEFIPSLGHLFLIAVLLAIISWIFYISFPLPGQERGRNADVNLSVVPLFLAGAVLLAVYHFVFSKLIFTSNINFEPFKVLELSVSTVFGISSMILLLLVPLLFFMKVFAAAKFVSPGVIVLSVIISLIIFIAASCIFSSACFALIVFYLAVLVFSYYTTGKHAGKLRLTILFSLIFSLYALYYILILSERKATDNIKVMSVSYSGENDPEAEYQLLDLWPVLMKDSTLADMMNSDYPVADVNKIRKYLNETYFYGYWGNYNFDIIICRNDSPLWIESDNRFAENCFDFFEDRIRNFGHRLTGTDFYFIDNQGGRAYYLGQMTFEQGSGISNRLFIELYADIDVYHAGYSELLLDRKYQGYSKLRNYSFAKYINGELALRTGEYPYQKTDNDYIGSDSEYSFFRAEGYNHSLFKNGNVTVIISRPAISLVDIFISFAYLLVFTLLFSGMLLLIIKKPEPARLVSFNFRQKLQVSFISILLFSLIAIGIVVAFYTIDQYQTRHYDNIKEKMNSVYLELAARLEEENALSSDWRDDNNSSLNDILIQLSNIFNTDINLYDYTGFLMATSRPEVFYRNLTGRRMDNMAFLNMVYFRKSEYIQKEKIGALEYISGYVPFYNREDNLLAYVNLPYFRMQSILAREISNLIVAVINFTLLLVLLAMSFAVFISGRLTSPLAMLGTGLASVKLGKKSEHLKYRGNDEIGELVKQYNIMVDEMEVSAIKLRNSEREYAWREMAKQIAHEINNPLTPMKLNVQQLFKSWKDKVPDFEKNLERFTENQIEYIENLSSIASAFSSFAKMPRTNPVEVDLVEQINTTLELFKNAGNVSFMVNWRRDEKVYIFADKEQLNGIFSNLIKNAIQSVPDGKDGLVSIDLDLSPGKVIVTISDNGTGIPDHLKSKMFTPNFTTKSSGMGLGLSIVKRYVENANGKIWFESQTGLGSRFFVEFPVLNIEQKS